MVAIVHSERLARESSATRPAGETGDGLGAALDPIVAASEEEVAASGAMLWAGTVGATRRMEHRRILRRRVGDGAKRTRISDMNDTSTCCCIVSSRCKALCTD